ncbi:DNA replication complex GINS family protein [Candidatus Pacearchaeota archaeon]|nr:DNA replication complex GINS family protein [Candidatus Pacearchaeota archaeon]
MLSYTDLYEVVRKEKYGDVLQGLPKGFLEDIMAFLQEKRGQTTKDDGLFQEEVVKQRKQLDNSLALCKELMRLRRKKLLQLVHIATETGIMKRDYENMLPFERTMFDSFVQAAERSDKEMQKILHSSAVTVPTQKMILFTQPVEPFVSMTGEMLGPYVTGELAHLDASITDVLVQGGKATYVD